MRDVCYPHDHISGLHCSSCAFHALALDGVCGLSQAGGIGYPKRNASQAGEFLDRIPRGPRTGTHDGPIEAKQSVEEARLSGIRLAAKDQADSLAQDPTFIRRCEQALDPAKDDMISASNLSPVCGSIPLVGEVYVSLDVSDRPEEMATNFFDLPSETSGELLFGSS